MTNRRFTRLTNAFSKKIENHAAAVALGYFAYNFIKINRTLRTTLSDGRWRNRNREALGSRGPSYTLGNLRAGRGKSSVRLGLFKVALFPFHLHSVRLFRRPP